MKQIKLILAISIFVVLAVSAYALINGRVATSIVTTSATGTFGKSVSVQSKLVTYFGNQPIAGQPVDLEILYSTYSVPLGTYYTNSQGIAKATINLVPYTINGRGNYTIGWTFRGNGIYSAPIPTAALTVK